MSSVKYRRTVEELEEVASKFWPRELSKQEAELSIIPKLLETQDDFISVLRVPVSNVEGIFDIVDASTLAANLFLKHLVVLADFGGEMLQRVNWQFRSLFPTRTLTYLWTADGKIEERVYRFKVLPINALNNNRLGWSGK